MDDIIGLMKKKLMTLYGEMQKLEGIFEETTAGGIVWKKRKKKKSGKGNGEPTEYPYYQFYIKRKRTGRRKVQKYIRKNEREQTFKWIEERRIQWKRLQQVKKLIKKLRSGLKVFGISTEEWIRRTREKTVKQALNVAKKKIFNQSCRYLTARGEYVRSRAEKVIANELFYRGIDYTYERKMKIRGKWMLPDFVIRHNGKIIYWEHLGMLDNREYAKAWLRKQKIYRQANIREGHNLIITKDNDLNCMQILRELNKYFCCV